MISSLNINKNICDKTFEFINHHLKENDDIVFLHEVPREEMKKLTEVYECYEPYYPNSAHFKTIAIVKDKSKFTNIELQPFISSQKNRIIFLINKETNDLIIGIHAPSSDNSLNDVSVNCFWNSVIKLLENIAPYKCLNMYGYLKKIRDIIIIGDFNIYDPKKGRKRLFNKLLSVGFCDLWIERNNPNNHYTYYKGSRIDYALVSDDVWDEYSIDILDETRTDEFTDHSAVVIKKI